MSALTINKDYSRIFGSNDTNIKLHYHGDDLWELSSGGNTCFKHAPAITKMITAYEAARNTEKSLV